MRVCRVQTLYPQASTRRSWQCADDADRMDGRSCRHAHKYGQRM